MEKITLNGFETVFDVLTPGPDSTEDNKDVNKNIEEDITEELTDEELEEIKSKKNSKNTNTDNNSNTKSVKSTKDTKNNDTDTEDTDSDSTDDDDNSDTDYTRDTVVEDDETDAAVGAFFDTLSEKLGWETDEEDKPKTAEELVNYFYDVIEENSKPSYASEEIEKLDEFVKNGGNIRDYFSIDAEVNLEDIDIEDSEDNQKTVIREYLKEKGLNKSQIDKKLTRYEDAGVLEDEAVDALEALKDIREHKKEQLLADQQKAAVEAKKRQQQFFDNVVNEIKGMDSIHGVAIPNKDKKALLDYIFKPDANGVTQYQKDYSKSLKNLITSAYFTMKGDTLLSTAQKQGKKDAITHFKNTLTKNSGVNTRSKQQNNSNDDNSTIWSSFTRQLRNL